MRVGDDLRVQPTVLDRRALLDREPAAFDPRINPCVDYGRFEEHIPAVAFAPRSRAELIATVAHLSQLDAPFKVRGTGHSSGGQTLYAGGVVVELRNLDRVFPVDEASDTVTVEGGASWEAVSRVLAATGRRVMVLTDNLRTTVAGTLSVGGFGDASHQYGLQASQVVALTLVTARGEVLELGTSDPYFKYTLCGLGQLGIIASATIRTRRAAPTLFARAFRFADLSSFVRDVGAVVAHSAWDIIKARLVWGCAPSPVVDAMAGQFIDDDPGLGRIDPALLHISPVEMGMPERLPLLDLMLRSQGEVDRQSLAVPALEFSLPLPDGLSEWERLRAEIEDLGLPALMPRGAAIAIVPCAPHLPWAPLSPTSAYSLLVALRPRVVPEHARRLIPGLLRLADSVVDVGGRIYMMSIGSSEPTRLARSLGTAYLEMKRLRRIVDPGNLCNPGLFERS